MATITIIGGAPIDQILDRFVEYRSTMGAAQEELAELAEARDAAKAEMQRLDAKFKAADEKYKEGVKFMAEFKNIFEEGVLSDSRSSSEENTRRRPSTRGATATFRPEALRNCAALVDLMGIVQRLESRVGTQPPNQFEGGQSGSQGAGSESRRLGTSGQSRSRSASGQSRNQVEESHRERAGTSSSSRRAATRSTDRGPKEKPKRYSLRSSTVKPSPAKRARTVSVTTTTIETTESEKESEREVSPAISSQSSNGDEDM